MYLCVNDGIGARPCENMHERRTCNIAFSIVFPLYRFSVLLFFRLTKSRKIFYAQSESRGFHTASTLSRPGRRYEPSDFTRERYPSTGICECVGTFTVSLPRTTAETPRRPCEAITIRSHFLASAARAAQRHPRSGDRRSPPYTRS